MEKTVDKMVKHMSGIVSKVEGSIEERRRLSSMGILEGAEIEMVHNNQGRGAIVKVKGSKLILSHEMAKKICVSKQKS